MARKTAAELAADINGTTAQLRSSALAPASRAAAAPAQKDDNDRVFATAVGEAGPVEKSFGFDSYGHFLHEIRISGMQGRNTSKIDEVYVRPNETIKKAATGMGELVGSDGGFLVPPQFSNKIFERMYRENDLLAKCDKYDIGSHTMTFPRNAESSRVTGSRWGGVQAYWVQEGSSITASAPTFGRLTLQLNKLACLARVTEELIQDSSTAMESYLTRVFGLEIGFATSNAVFRGTGAGQPLGILNAACGISVSKETGQAANTIVPQNIAKMWARRFALGPTGQYVWLVNQDTSPQLNLMTLGIGTAGVAVYLPPGGLSAAPYATLMGAPVMEVEFASTLGTNGDIVLVDLSQYVAVTKGGLNSMSSMHVYFTTDEQAFRTTFRLDGAPWWATALTPFQGTNTQSPIVTLATRS